MVLQKYRREIGSLEPAFAANTPFKLNAIPPDGILKSLDFYVYGTHVTAITTAATDGEWNIITAMTITINRKRGLDPVIWNVLPRDLKWINAQLNGQLPANTVTAADGGAHYGLMRVPLSLPAKRVINPLEWGIDTRDIAGPIVIEGQYGPVTNLGTGTTAITSQTRVYANVAERLNTFPPKLVLSGNQHFIDHISDGRLGPTVIGTGFVKALYGLFLRNHDASDLAAQRQDGLITRFLLEHSKLGLMIDEFQIVLKKQTNLFTGLAAADIPSGIVFPVMSTRGSIGDMPVLTGGQDMKLTHDSLETVPSEVTAVTPASGDGIYAITIGAQFNQRRA